MKRRTFLGLAAGALAAAQQRQATSAGTLDADRFRHYIEDFNRTFPEDVVNYIPDAHAWEWLSQNIPLFTCPDDAIEQLYYYRWWAWRKHIKETPAGFLITEFLKPVKHASEYNALSCALGHHIAEGRWLQDPRFIDGDIHFWLHTGDGDGIRKNLHQFSGWVSAALYDRWLADGRGDFAISFLDALLADYKAWEQERLTASGLFWQRDVSDGMESSISGGRNVKNIRPSINSYMYGNAKAIAAIADMSGNGAVASEYRGKAARLKELILQRLWNRDAGFFETRLESGEFAPARENIGFTPWFFDLPGDQGEYEASWKQLLDPQGFYAPFGPTTAERRNPDFQLAYEGDDCQWNGPNWPFATTITLRALGNVINRNSRNDVFRESYCQTFEIYTRSQHLSLEDGRAVPFVDENLNPLTGEWLARAMKLRKKTYYGRGDHYNHSGYADLVITGLAGLRPRADSVVEVNPIVPAGKWAWFCLDRVPYHGRMLTIVWDKAGTKFAKGKGLRVLDGGKEIAHSEELGRVTGRLS
jgi:Trehalase